MSPSDKSKIERKEKSPTPGPLDLASIDARDAETRRRFKNDQHPYDPSSPETKQKFIERTEARHRKENPALYAALLQFGEELRTPLYEKSSKDLVQSRTDLAYLEPLLGLEAVVAPVQQESYFIQNGIQYMPLPDAARLAGLHRETLLNWMKNEIKIDGEPIQSLYFKPTGNHFVSKVSVERLANRFVKWPSEEPAGPIALGRTQHETGYLLTSEAAHIIGIPHTTLRHWVRENRAPLDEPLNVVKCTPSGYFYIQQQDVFRLAKHVQEHGIPRGRRPQNRLQP